MYLELVFAKRQFIATQSIPKQSKINIMFEILGMHVTLFIIQPP